MVEARPRLSKVAIPRISLIVSPGYVSNSHKQLPFNQHTKPSTTHAPGYRLLG